MKTRSLSLPEIISLAEREETHFYDNKSIRIKGSKVQKIAVAFANADGGEILFGVLDKKEKTDPIERWEGIESQEEFNHILQSIQAIEPSLPHTWEFLQDTNKTYALRVTIEKSDSVHKCTDRSVYVRKSAQSLPLKDTAEIQALSYSKGESSYEDNIVNSATAEDIFEASEIKDFLKDYSPLSDPIDFTINQNLVDRNQYDPRVAGILLFSENPVPLLPKRCGIKITRYDTSEKKPERDHLKQQFSVEGCLYQQINEASSIITEIMQSVKIMGTNGLTNAKYPPETVWEILVNAVIHRDYSISDDTQVLIFNNRIEIISPGKLPGYVTVENILDSRFSRNSKIVRVLNKYKDAPNKDMGEGLNTAFQRMQDFKLQPPKIEETGNYIKATIAHTPLASPEETILEYLKSNPQIKNSQARELTGIRSENVMKRVFYSLRDKGLLAPVMSSTGTTIIAWSLVS